MKKRGLKRYYRNLKEKDQDWSGLNFTDPEKAWFDLWDTHFDWNGYGNESFKRRKPHLDALLKNFDVLAEKAKSLKIDYQIWATIFDYDSADDALYIHTPNPNQDNFPLKIKDLSEISNLTNVDLNVYLKNLSGYKVLFGEAEENYCIIYKDQIGIPLV